MKRRETTALILLLLLVGCESKNTGPSFKQAVVPILNRHCVMCHMDQGAQGELSLHPQPYAAMVGVSSSQSDMLLVTPGDVQASYFYHKLQGSHLDVGGEGESMPYQRDLLAAEELNTVEQWIAQGANNN
jgi:hypothetical protein